MVEDSRPSDRTTAETLRRAAAQIRNDCGGIVSRNTCDGRRWLPVADWLDDTAEFFNPNSAIWGRALTVARAYLGESA